MVKKEGEPKTLEEIKKEREALKEEQTAILGDAGKSDEIIKEQEEKKKKAKAKKKELEDKKSGKKKADGPTTADTTTPETVDTTSNPDSNPDTDSETTTEAEETKEIKSAGEEMVARLEQSIEEARAALENLIPGYAQDKEVYESDLKELSEKLKTAKEILADRKEKEFLYYALEKSANPILLERLKNINNSLLDLRKIEKDRDIIDFTYLQTTGVNEGFFTFNRFGFVQIMKNVSEITHEVDGKKITSSYSEDAIYKILGPNGEIIADDIQGYAKATEIFSQKSGEYEEKIKKEFEVLTPGEENTEWLDVIKNKTEEQIQAIIADCEAKTAIAETIPEKYEFLDAAKQRRDAQMEHGSLRMKKGVIDGLTKWETYGEGEQGVKGFGKRMFKAGVNIALIGAASAASIELLAKNSTMITATALSSVATSSLVKRTMIGLGFASVMDVAGKYIKNEKVKKYLPIALGLTAALAMPYFAGAAAATIVTSGAVAGISSAVGYFVSKNIKGKFTNEKIEERKDAAIQKLFAKYQIEGGALDLSRIPEIEEECDKLIKKFENITIAGKIADQAFKLATGAAISTLMISGSGYAREHVGGGVHQVSAGDAKTNAEHAAALKNLEHMKADHESSVKHLEQLKAEHETVLKWEAKAEEIKVAMVHEGGSYEHSLIHQIEVDHGVKAVELGYKGDVNDVKALHEFAGHQAHVIALHNGIVNSAGNQEGITAADKIAPILKIENGHATIEDTTTDGKVVAIHSEGDKFGEHTNKYEYTIKHIDTHVENTHHYNPNEAPQQVDAETGQPIGTEHQIDAVTGQSIIDTPQYDPNNPNFDHQYDAPQQVDAETGKPMGGENNVNSHTGDNNSQINPTQENSSIMNNLTPEIQAQIHTAYAENIHHLFPNDKLMSEWDHIKDSASADRMVELGESNNLKPELQPLADHIQRLIEITGLHPHGVSIANPDPETVDHFMTRATTEAQVTGKIDDIRLSDDVHTADTSHSNNQSNEVASEKHSTENSMLVNNEGKHINTVELKENGIDAKMKFIYDASGKVTGSNISGSYSGTENIDKHYNMNAVPGDMRHIAISQFKQLDMSTQFLSKLPIGSQEYQLLHDSVALDQQFISHQYGDNVIKPEDILK